MSELPISGETDLDGLAALFRRLGSIEHGLLVLTVKGTEQFVQYSGGTTGIQLDLPMVTRSHQDRETRIRAFLAGRGERVVERRGTDGARFLDVDLPADPERLAQLTAGIVCEVFGAPATVRLVIQSDGLPPAHGARPDVAALGLVRPPLVYLVAIVTGALLQRAAPFPFFPSVVARPLGLALVLAAIALFAGSAARFREAGTPVPARKPTTAIVRTGPYRFSRNPIYLAFSLFHLGIATWVNSLWLLVTLAGAVALIHFVVIRREERYLERRFGAEYLAYKASVRRWL